MAKKTLGYVQLEWTCSICGTKNAGFDRLCKGCGAAQPDDVQFQQAAQEVLLSEESELEQAKAGPDVHCRFCGTRNPAGAAACRQCGAELIGATAREGGQVLGAHRDKPAEPVLCPSCATPNDPLAKQCKGCGASLAGARPAQPESAPARPQAATGGRSKTGMIALIGVATVICIAIAVIIALSGRTKELTGRVEGVQWTRTIGVEALVPVTYEAWYDKVPAGSVLGACEAKYHHAESEPVPGAKEVCGTPYTVDTGSGAGQVVQDCEYHVYADWCQYTVDEWREVDAVVISGEDLSPYWPDLALLAGQRQGQSREKYQVRFASEEAVYTYQTEDANEFSQFKPGSRWVLEVNTFNQLRSVSPAD
jgi:hypothetical protein